MTTWEQVQPNCRSVTSDKRRIAFTVKRIPLRTINALHAHACFSNACKDGILQRTDPFKEAFMCRLQFDDIAMFRKHACIRGRMRSVCSHAQDCCCSSIYPAEPPTVRISKKRKTNKWSTIPDIPMVAPLIFMVADTNRLGCQLFGDNQSLINQLNLVQRMDAEAERISAILVALGGAWQRNLISLRTSSSSFFAHIPRSINSTADFLVNQALDSHQSYIKFLANCVELDLDMLLAIRGFSDGGIAGTVHYINNIN